MTATVLDEALTLLSQFLAPDEEIVLAILAAAGKTLGEDDDWRRTLTSTLRPRPEDYARVFLGEASQRAREGYESFWSAEPILEVRREHAEVRAAAALAGQLHDEAVAYEFPGGYREIVDQLVPDRWWLTWQFVAPGAPHGVQYDGLVRLDDHFAWFPKPWRVLG